MRYSILMPYLDRVNQLARTLESFQTLYSARNDWEVIIVADAKNTREQVRELVQLVDRAKLPRIRVRFFGQKDWHNPAPLYNYAAVEAFGSILLLTSPEVRHLSDVLTGLDWEYPGGEGNHYVVCACRAHSGAKRQWFQHSVHRPADYHFCSAISAQLYRSLGGMDERFSMGCGYEDDEWRDRVRRAGVRIVRRDDLVTEHQAHGKPLVGSRRRALLSRNRELYASCQ